MNELQAITQRWAELRRNGQAAALATVVNVSGSAYRRPGARMLIASDGATVGSVSGGCLERDVCERAQTLLRAGEQAAPVVVTYDATTEADIVFGSGTGCNGVVQVLIERLQEDAPQLDFIARCLTRDDAGVLATVIGGADFGKQLRLDGAGIAAGDLGASEGYDAVLADAQAQFTERQARLRAYDTRAGAMTVLLETIAPPVPLLLCGAGADAAPVARIAHELGWRVTVVDPRAAYANRMNFPTADEMIVAPLPEADVRLSARTLAVVMHHHYDRDKQALGALLPSPAAYVGVLGPRKRTAQMLGELAAQGFVMTDEMRNKLHAPIGLDIGAETPAQIALAIVAEMQAVLAERTGDRLRQRAGAIHHEAQAEPRAHVTRVPSRIMVAGLSLE